MFPRRFVLAVALGILIAPLFPASVGAASAPTSAAERLSAKHSTGELPRSSARPANAPYTLPRDLLAKATTLTRLRTILAFGTPAWSILVLIAVLQLGWPARLRNRAERVSPRLWVQGLIFLPVAILFLVALPLPLEIYGHHIARAFGLSVESWRAWGMDQLKALLLSEAVFIPVLFALFWMIRRSPRRWWIWFWVATLPLIVFAVFISPLWIAPLFNHFSPLQTSDPQLVVQLERLARHAGLDIPPSRMFLMRASEKVTGLNAYVTGIGASKRIVVWDNTVRKLPPDEILFITGHEMGHYVLNHIYKGLAFAALMLLVLLWLAAVSLRWLLFRCGARWGVREAGDWAALAVLVLLFTVFSFLASPIANSFSRWEEHQADIYGQEAIHGLVADPQQTAREAFVALGRTYLDAPNPNPLVEFWLSSHPSISKRVSFAEDYDPWLAGRQPKYFQK